MQTKNNYPAGSKLVSAREWFGSGRRLPYDPATKSIGNETQGNLFVFNRRIVYRDQKPDQNPDQNPGNSTITFLPGFPFGSYDWAKIDALIETQQPVDRLFVEYIGQGDSDKPEDYPYSTFSRADEVEAIWKYHNIQSTFAVTFDYSSLVVMELLRRQQEKIERGVQPPTLITKVLCTNGGYFTDGHSHPVFTTPLLKTRLGKRSARRAQTSDFTFNRMIKGLWSRRYRVSEAELAEVREAIRRWNGALFLHNAAGFVSEHKANGERLNLLPIVEKMHTTISFHIIGSEKDQFEHRQVKLAKERLSKFGVTVEVLPGGHMLTMEQPELLADRILASVNSSSPASHTPPDRHTGSATRK